MKLGDTVIVKSAKRFAWKVEPFLGSITYINKLSGIINVKSLEKIYLISYAGKRDQYAGVGFIFSTRLEEITALRYKLK